MLIQGREPVSQRAEEESSDCIKEPEKAQEPTLGAPFIRLDPASQETTGNHGQRDISPVLVTLEAD